MQAISEVAVSGVARVSEAGARDAAGAYVSANIDPLFEVVDGKQVDSNRLGRAIWQFLIRCEQGPLATLAVDAQSGNVIPLTGDEIRAVRERAAIFAARQRGVLPVDENGYVVGEYARRQADSYLGAEVSLFHSAADGVFVPLDGSTQGALWRFAIQVRLPRLGALGITGAIDVDAQSGEVVPLSSRQIKQIRERADALVEFRTQTAER